MSRVLRMVIGLMTLIGVAVGLSACGNPISAIKPALTSSRDADQKDVGHRKIGKPYKVGGRWFHPKEDETYDKTGIASWYGPKFHGKKTANGERFDQNAMTAAHPTMPLPSFVRVTVSKTGRSAVVRVNDRGPFKRGRIIDVSKAAAKKLGFINSGMTKVRVQYLGPAPIGGGERETRRAAVKFGEGADAPGGGIRRLLSFGGNDGADKPGSQRASPVKTASAQPSTRAPSRETARADAPRTRPTGSRTATAYRAGEKATSAGNDAIDALLDDQDGEDRAAAPERPLQMAPDGKAPERISGAHDLFQTGN